MDSKYEKLIILSIIILASALLFFQLEKKSLWGDELATVEISQRGNAIDIISSIAEDKGEPHPPLQYILMHYSISLFGNSDFSVRLPFVIFGIFSLIIFYKIIRNLFDFKIAALSTFLLGFSPFFIMYSRMARYYSLILLLSLISYYLFFCLMKAENHNKKLYWAAYIINSALMLYTYIPSIAVFIGQFSFVIYNFLKKNESKEFLSKFLIAQIISAIIFTPWILVIQNRIGSSAVGSSAIFNGIIQFPLRIIYPFYVYSVGETLYPFKPITIVGLLIILALIFYAITEIKKENKLNIALLFFIPLMIVVLILQFFNTGFTDTPQRAIFAVPFFYFLVSYGIIKISNKPMKTGIFIIVFLIIFISLNNYYSDREYITSNYLVPAKQIVRDIENKTTSNNTLIVSSHNSAFDYYYSKIRGEGTHYIIDRDGYNSIKDNIQIKNFSVIWFVIENSDTNSPLMAEWTNLTFWLENNGYYLENQSNYTPIDSEYNKFKEKILHRSTYHFRVNVKEYHHRL
jgi:uncharacterized membrane protein